jgi:hypothetical protein
MTGGLLWYVGEYSRNIPWWDEWDLVPALSGNEPALWQWLWSQHNEHRIPLPKVVHLALAALTGTDFRAACYFNALALSAAALAMIAAARRLRGFTSATDGFFPLALLHWGQRDNLFWGFQVQLVASTVLLLFLVASFLALRDRRPATAILVAGLLAVGMALCGANGLAVVPALTLFFAVGLLLSGRVPELRPVPVRLSLAVAAAGTALVVPVYLIGLVQPEVLRSAVDVPTRLRAGLEVVFMSEGPTALSRGARPLGVVVAAVALAGLVLLGRTMLRRPAEWLRGSGLLIAAAAGVVSLAFAIGWGRVIFQPTAPEWIGASTRYVTLVSPLACCGYLAWVRLGNRLAPLFLAVTAAAILPSNTLVGLAAGQKRAAGLDLVTAEARSGLSPRELAQKYGGFIHPVPEDILSRRFEMLRDARIGPYKSHPSANPAGP